MDILDAESPDVESLAETDTSVAAEDIVENDTLDEETGSIALFVKSQFTKAEDARRQDEERWVRNYRNYRGLYGPDTSFTENEKSRVFVKVTKTKVQAAYGQVIDVLFGNNSYPISIEPTSVPEGIAEAVHFDVQSAPEKQEQEAKLQPGETMQSLKDRLGPLQDKLEPVMGKLKEGPGGTQTAITFHPALIAAKKMEKQCHDQLEESSANQHLRSTAFETVLFGSGVTKGPMHSTKTYPKWSKDGSYEPIKKVVPKVSHTSVWNVYPDPDALRVEECEFFIERHKMSRTQLRTLKKRPMFRKNAIDLAIKYGAAYEEKWWEHIMDESEHNDINRYEVLEYWGYLDREDAEADGLSIPDEFKDQDQVSVNIWVCNGEVLRLVMNVFTPTRIPYMVVPYELNPYSFFGIGVAENMEDTQILMNGFMRMAVDNAALSGNLIIEVDETHLVPGDDMKVYPGKIFRRSGGAPGQAIFGTKFPNVSNENMQMFDKARQLADESTGLPSFAHGQTGVSGVGRTSSGISMLMSAANGSIRTVIKNFDDFLLAPLGKALYHFNMQFNFDEEFIGDLDVKARGTESLMANEVRSQRLMQFLSVVQNPMLAPFAKMDYIIREIAKSMELDPDKVVNNLGDAAIQAEVLKKFQDTMIPSNPAEGAGGPPSVSDTSGGGGGNIGVGSAPSVGEQGFSGNVS